MYIRNGAWGIISGFGNVEKNSEEDERGAAGECVSRQLLFFFRWKRQMGQRMNEENQEQDQKDEIAGKQEEPGQIVSEKVEKKREEKPKKKRLRIQGAAWRRLDNTAKLFAAVSGENLSSVFRISAVLKEKVDPELLQRALVRTLPEIVQEYMDKVNEKIGTEKTGRSGRKNDGLDEGRAGFREQKPLPDDVQ